MSEITDRHDHGRSKGGGVASLGAGDGDPKSLRNKAVTFEELRGKDIQFL